MHNYLNLLFWNKFLVFPIYKPKYQQSNQTNQSNKYNKYYKHTKFYDETPEIVLHKTSFTSLPDKYNNYFYNYYQHTVANFV